MNSIHTWKIFGTGLLALALAAGLFVYTERSPAPNNDGNREVAGAGTISLTIEGLYAGKAVSIAENETVLEVLQKLNAADPRLRLATKEYSGLGTLVESMNGNKNGAGDKYWQYNVDGIMPQIGADKFELDDGDAVEWYFGKSTF